MTYESPDQAQAAVIDLSGPVTRGASPPRVHPWLLVWKDDLRARIASGKVAVCEHLSGPAPAGVALGWDRQRLLCWDCTGPASAAIANTVEAFTCDRCRETRRGARLLDRAGAGPGPLRRVVRLVL